MFSRTKGIAALALALTLPMAACDSGTDAEFGSITLQLTDAPGDVAHAWVTIDHIYLQPGEDGNEAGRVDLMTEDVTTDLITLANDIEGLVEDVAVPAGFYEQLRVVVSDACIAVKSETDGLFDIYTNNSSFTKCVGPEGVAEENVAFTGTLQEASIDQTGIKVLIGGDEGLEITGDQKILLLDFDVGESFGHAAGGSGQWVMHPVIKASEIGLTSSVTVSVTAEDGLEMPVIDGTAVTLGNLVADLSTEEVDVALADEDGDGVWTATFQALVPDPAVTPVVTISGEALTVTTDPTSVSAPLVSGQDVQVTFVVTAVTADGGGAQ